MTKPKAPEPTKTTGTPEDQLKACENYKDSRAEEAKAKRDKELHEAEIEKADKLWKERADGKRWDEVIADLEVYKFSGQATVTEDPRRNKEYRDKVVEELGFGPKSTRTDLTIEDRALMAEVIGTKAAAFRLEGTPRTVLRHLMHDTIPTGPPVRTPPHNLRGEEAQWVDDQLQKEVESGQLERGNSETTT